MRLSLPILMQWFEHNHYNTVSYITKDVIEIISFQLSDQPLPSHIGRICRADLLRSDAGSDDSAIQSGEDLLIIKNTSPALTLDLCFKAFEYYLSWENSLLSRIYNHITLQEILDLMHDVLNRPMSICNARGWDYAMTGGQGPYIHPQSEAFSGRESSGSSIADRHTFLSSLNDIKPIVTYSNAHRSNVLIANIWLEGKKTGAILAYENNEAFTLADVQLMSIFQTIITLYASLNKGILRSRSALTEYLIDILNQTPIRSYSLNSILKYPKWKISDSFIIVCIGAKDPAEPVFFSRICDDFEDSELYPQAFVYDSHIVSLINLKYVDDLANLDKILAEILPGNLCCGVSHEFNDIRNFQDYYPQACAAMEYAMKEKQPYATMRRIALDQIRQHVSSDTVLQNMLHPDIPFLIQYDRDNNTVYANTLYWFLIYACNYTSAAARLDIHRNTLIYRINRIESMLSANLNDAADRELLLLSFMLYKQSPVEEKAHSSHR